MDEVVRAARPPAEVERLHGRLSTRTLAKCRLSSTVAPKRAEVPSALPLRARLYGLRE